MVGFKVLMARIGGKMKAALRVSEVMANHFDSRGLHQQLCAGGKHEDEAHAQTSCASRPGAGQAGVVRLYEAHSLMTKHTKPRPAGG
jgi:hypothetical protein